MTNTQQMSINHMELAKGITVMHGWTEQTQLVVRARIREREVEAASERLAATARTTTPRSPERASAMRAPPRACSCAPVRKSPGLMRLRS